MAVCEVTLATDADAEWLDAFKPSGSMPDVHRQRLALQQKGVAAYLIAWLDGRRVGFVLVHFVTLSITRRSRSFPTAPMSKAWRSMTMYGGVASLRP